MGQGSSSRSSAVSGSSSSPSGPAACVVPHDYRFFTWSAHPGRRLTLLRSSGAGQRRLSWLEVSADGNRIEARAHGFRGHEPLQALLEEKQLVPSREEYNTPTSTKVSRELGSQCVVWFDWAGLAYYAKIVKIRFEDPPRVVSDRIKLRYYAMDYETNVITRATQWFPFNNPYLMPQLDVSADAVSSPPLWACAEIDTVYEQCVIEGYRVFGSYDESGVFALTYRDQDGNAVAYPKDFEIALPGDGKSAAQGRGEADDNQGAAPALHSPAASSGLPAPATVVLPDPWAAHCKICYERKLDCALNCGHVYCTECVETTAVCPECRADIVDRRRIYL